MAFRSLKTEWRERKRGEENKKREEKQRKIKK
jgi:hypothetical protein